MTAVIGHCVWALPAIVVPGVAPGGEMLCVLNAEERHANVQVTVFCADRDPIGPYELTVAGRRVRQVRFGDVLASATLARDVPYAAIVTADIPIVVQFLRHRPGQPPDALLSMLAFPVPA